MSWPPDLHGFTLELAAGVVVTVVAKLWAIGSGYVFTHYIIDGLITRGRKWLHKNPIENAIIIHYKKQHKLIVPAYKKPSDCQIEDCTLVP